MDVINFLKDFDLAALLPSLDAFEGTAKFLLWILMAVGPVLMLLLGVMYYAKPPAEANFSWGFRTYFGMSSVAVWRYTQRIAGMCWIVLGGAMAAVALFLGFLFLPLHAGAAAVIAIWVVSIELILVILSWIGINIMVLKHYDKDGNLRQ